MQQTLYMKYGSRVTSGMAECLYDRICADPDLAPFFASIDIDVLREHVSDFLTVLTGGPDMYRGRDIGEAHADHRISKAHFERLILHIIAAADDLQIEADDGSAIIAAIRGLEDQVVTLDS